MEMFRDPSRGNERGAHEIHVRNCGKVQILEDERDFSHSAESGKEEHVRSM